MMKPEEKEVLEVKDDAQEISDKEVALEKEDEGNSWYLDMDRVKPIIH